VSDPLDDRQDTGGRDVRDKIPQTEVTGLYGAVVKMFSKKMLGDVPDAVGVYWHNKPVLNNSALLTDPRIICGLGGRGGGRRD